MAHKLVRGGGIFRNACRFESPARRPALARRVACSLLAAAMSVCMLPDANAEIQGFQSPYSGSSIFAYQLHGATLDLIDLNNPGKGFVSNLPASKIRFSGAPSGLTISSHRVDTGDDNLLLTFSCTGACLTVSSNTSVTVQIERTGYIQYGLLPATPLWYSEGTFTIKPTPKGLGTSTPTNSSTVTEAGSTSTFTVRLRRAPSATVTVAVSSGDTTEGSVSPNSLTFTTQNWSTAQTVTVTGADDNIQDGSVSWNVVLNPSSTDTGYNALSNVNVAMTTTDNEGSPSFSINSPSVTEGDTGSVNLTFTVTMSPESTSQYTVDYADAGTGTATSGTDYTAVTANTLTFAAGATSRTITVSVTGDTTDEGASETVVITLSNASSGSTIGTASGTGTIMDNDPKAFSIDSPSVAEGDSGSVNLVFTVTLSHSSPLQFTVDYAQTGGTATSGTDYTAVAANTLTFAANTTTQTITVSVTGDTAVEGNETVVITLSNASSGSIISTATGTGTIVENDLVFSIDSPSVTEGDSGPVNLVFTVTLSASSTSQLTVDYAQTGGTATSGTDYTAVPAGMLTFAPGVRTRTITVSVMGDTVVEGLGETVVLTLSNASTGISTGSSIVATATATGTITDDDPKFSIDSPRVAEGDSGSVNMTFTVTKSAPSTGRLTVVLSDSNTGTATAGSPWTTIPGADYTPAFGWIIFEPGETSLNFNLPVLGDTLDEGNETVVVTLTAPAGTGLGTATGTGTIVDDDPKFSINSPSVVEGDSGSVNLVFTVTLSASSTFQSTVDYTSSDGTATSAADYTAVSGTLTFAASETSKTITVPVTGDTVDEGTSETLTVTLSNASGAGISTATGTGTITDNDPKFSIADASATEGDSGSVNMTFTVTLSGASSSQHTVDYASSDGTATAGTDYTAVSGTLTFAAGTTSQTFTVSVTGDTVNEANETLTVTLSNASTGTGIATASGTGTITDNDTPGFSINSPSVTEGDSGSVNLVFTVSLNPAPAAPATVDYARTGGTATSGTDYTAISSSTLTFAAGTTSQTITVSVRGDTVDEGASETVVLTLSSASAGTNISTSTGTGTITDDDPKFSINSPSVTEGDSSMANLVFTVTLSASSTSQYTVDYAQTGGTATSGTDYTAVTANTLTFAAGTTSQTITVSVTGDTTDESNETVVITLSNASSGTAISTAIGTGTIRDDDPNFSINSPSVVEGDSGSVNLVFTVTLSAASTSQYTVDYAQTGGTATSGTDYTAVASNTLTFAANTTTRTVTVSVRGDTVDEGNETVVITLSNPSSGTVISTATGTGTITDDDPKFSINSPTVAEGDSSTTNLTFTVTLSAAGLSQHTVGYAQTGGTATSGTDYTAVTAGVLTFAAGVTSRTITVSVTGDTVDEGNETVVLTLSNASSGTAISTATGTGTIRDDDPKFSINSPSVVEGDSSTANLVFTVTLSAASTSPLTVDYARTGGTATSGTDYTAVSSSTLTFAANSTSETITVSVTGDTTDEANETVVITLSNAPAGTGISTATGTGTIMDDDPKFSINSPTVTEGDSSSVNLVFMVTLSASSTSSLSVDYAQTGGTATSGTDYTAVAAGTLTFAAGTTSRTITVSVTGDTANEVNETVIITLSNATAGAGIGTAIGTGTITDNDTPGFSINSPSVAEGDSSTTNLVFTVTLSPAPATAATVNWAEGTGGTATSGTDYTAIAGGTLTFSAGTTTQTITVSVTGDTTHEADETVVITLSNASTGTNISTATGTGTITNDDSGLTIDSPSVTEGDSGSANLVFTVTLDPASSSQVTVNYARTGGTATSGTDFTALAASTTLTFAANETSKTITVSVTGDTINEANETVIVTLSSASGADIVTASGTGTITDDDTPSFSINSPSVVEGDSSTTNLEFTVTLSPASYQATTVDYATASTGTATAGTDFTAISATTLTFAAGDTSKTFMVSVTGDTTDEGAGETVVAALSNATGNAEIGTSSGTGTITDDDPKFSIGNASATEGDTGSVNMTFTVTLSGAGNSQYTVDYASSDGTATAGADYTAVSGMLTFAAGTTSRTLTVSVTGDTANEANETVIITLSNASAGTAIATATGTGTITDNDTPNFSINSPSVAEGDSSTTNLVFTVTLSPAPATAATVNWAEGTGGTATSGTDYTAIAGGTLTFSAGTATQTITVSVTGDTSHEADETVVITLSNASTGTNISTASGTGTITNDDSGLTIDSPSVTEGDSGSANLVFTVTLDPASSSQVTVNYARTGGTATSGTDFTALAASTTLTFAANETSKTITVLVTGDTINEANETVIVTLSSASGADLVTASGTGTITDDDTPMFSINSPSVVEGDSSTTNLEFTVTLSPASYQATTVDYATATAGTATAGTDFTAIAATTLTFAAGDTSKTFMVSVTGDTTDEGAGETVVAALSDATGNAEIGTSSGTGTITDDDPKFSIADASATEGDTGSVNMTFTVTLSGAGNSQYTVDYASSDGTATAGTDYTAVSGTLTFAAGTTSRTLTVSVTGDAANEANETLTVTLSNASAGTAIATATGTGTITDNDTPSFSINSPSVAEGDSSTTNLVFTVTLSPASATQVTVDYADAGTGTATSGTDYTALASSTTLTFVAGTTTQTITVSVSGDTTYEADETVVLTLSGASTGTNISTASGTGTITNDDPGLSIDSPSVAEGDSNSVNLVFTVTMSPASSSQVTVNYARSGGTATSGTDFTALAASNTLTFAANETSKTITVSVTGDTINEADETVIITLSSASGADIVTASGTGTITDNDTPNFTIDSPSVAEGDSSTTSLTFTVTLNPASHQPVTVDYAQTGGTATSGTDYTAIAAGMLSFAAGAASQTITVTVTGDTMYEASETVIITLSNASSGTNIAAATGTGTIANDDQGLLIDSPSVAEGDSGAVNLAFTVTLDPASTTQVTVNYADTGSGTASSGTDYAAIGGGTLTFSAGETRKTIAVSVTGDTSDEPDETVVIALSNASGASIVTARGTGTITDNDIPGFSIDSPSAAEGDSESTSLTFTVTLNPASYRQVSVNYADAGSGTATSGSDYAAFGGTLTFAAGETSKTIAVSVTDDALDEPDETVVIALSGASSGASIAAASGTGTIADNDIPGFSIDSPSVVEGDSGTVNLTFTVSLNPASHQPATVNYADAGTGTATSGTDYETLAGGTLRFAAGESSKTIAVSVTGDAEFEPDETVVIVLSSATSDASIATASGTGTIANDDDTPVFSIDSPSVEEGDTDSVNLTFTVTLTPGSFEPATVNYADTGTGTAEAGEDYRSIAGGTLTFAAGETSQTIDVSVLGDVLSEQDETIVLVLSDPNPSYTIGEARGTGTIADNDASVLDEVDTEIVAEVAREVTTSVVAAVGNRIASVVGGAAIAPPIGAPPVNLPPVTVPPTGGFANGGLLSILERSARHSRERERGLERSEMSLYRSLDGASFVYTPGVAALGANGSAEANGGGLSGAPTVWGSIDYRKLSGGGADALQWDGELASVNIGTDTMVDAGVLVGLAAGMSKGSFGYQGSAGGTSGVVKVRVKSLNPYIGWSVSESASLWAAVGYGKGKVNYNDGATGEAASKMSIASAALGGRYRLHSSDAALCSCLIQVDLKGEAWGLQTRVEGDERRPMGSKSRAHGVRVAVERLQSSALESGASLTLSGEAGLRWDGGDGDTGTGIEMGGTAEYRNPATRMKLVATGRALLDHESDRKEWGAGVTAGYQLDSRETGLTYSSSLSHGQPESGVDSLWDSRVASRASEDTEPTTRLDAEIGYRLFGASGLHTPYVGIGVEEGSKRDYRIGMRYASESALSSGLEFERREADSKRPDHRVMLTGQIDW